MFNAQFNKVFDTLDILGVFNKKPHLRGTLHAPCHRELYFSVSQTESLQLHEIKAALRPWSSSPTGARRSSQRPQHPFGQKKEVPHPGNTRKHKHSKGGRSWKCYQVYGHGNISLPSGPSKFLGLRTLPRTGIAARNAERCFCSATRITVPFTGKGLCFYLRYQKHILELHPSAQGGLQVSKRSLILNTTMDLFLHFK